MTDSRRRWSIERTPLCFVVLMLTRWFGTSEALEIGCPNDPSIEGVATLADLKEYMSTEFISALTDPDNRGPPYVYILCPNTTYTVQNDNDIITPFLDGSVISCGIDGSSGNGCFVEGYISQVRLQEQSTLPSRVRTTTVFSGITFQNSRQWSILAWDKAGTIASFNDCIWRGSQGERVIDVRYAPVVLNETAAPTLSPSAVPSSSPSVAPTDDATDSLGPTVEGNSLAPTVESSAPSSSGTQVVPTGMEIHLNDCLIEDTSSGPLSESFSPILVQSARLTLNNVMIRNNEGVYTLLNANSIVHAKNSTFQDNTPTEFVAVTNVGELDLTSCNFFNNTVGTGIVGATGAVVSISRGDFMHNAGFVDIVSVTVGAEDAIPSVVTLEETCFESSMYGFGAVLAGEGTSFTWMDVFAENNEGEGCPDGVFYEEESGSCSAPSGCVGVCEEFDLPFCPWRMSSSPSSEPTASPGPSALPSAGPSTEIPSTTPSLPPSLQPSAQPIADPTAQPTVNATEPAVIPRSEDGGGGGGSSNTALIAGVTASVGIVLIGGVAGYLVFGRNV